MEINRQAAGHTALRHLGDSLGHVFAFILNYDPDRAMLFLADYLALLEVCWTSTRHDSAFGCGH
jgi:hypothetical protein